MYLSLLFQSLPPRLSQSVQAQVNCVRKIADDVIGRVKVVVAGVVVDIIVLEHPSLQKIGER